MARERPSRAVAVPPLAGRAALAPAVALSLVLSGAGIGYAVIQSLGLLAPDGTSRFSLDAYRDVGSGRAAGDVWSSAGFTLWVAGVSTLLAAVCAIGLVAAVDRRDRPGRVILGALHLNLAIPHIVWAVGLLLVIGQSGLLARAAAAVSLIDDPSQFPVVVRDRFGIGIIVHYTLKELPFLSLVGLALLRAQPSEFALTARSLGATGWSYLRRYVVPTIAPGVATAAGFVFAFVFGAFEAPMVLGSSTPRMLSILGLDLFQSQDLATRPAAMALGTLMSLTAGAAVGTLTLATARRRRG